LKVRGLFCLILILAGLAPALGGAGLLTEETIPLVPSRQDYELKSHPLIQGSETVRADTLLLVPLRDYRLDPRTGRLTLLGEVPAQYLHVSAILVPEGLREPRFVYRVREVSDSLLATIARTRAPWLGSDGNLSISGSKTFAITFSDDDSFDLKQSLFVNLDGELADNVRITAQLSDSQSKLTPEGDSKELSSLDKVFIRVHGQQYELAMGDLDWKFEGTRYINYAAKFEGLNAFYRDRHSVQAGYSASGGKSAFGAIAIVDGKQGPYYLNPTGLQSTQMIIAGSERIYLDGSLLERGTDYYIDYSEGSVMFRVLVTSGNLVNAYYQYSDEYYKQSTYFNSSRFQLGQGLSLSHHLIHQTDAKDSPLLHEFSGSDLDSLRSAGDGQAWGNGAVMVEPGSGSYLQRTSASGTLYYEYAGADSTADYLVYFSFVGSGKGDYEEYSSGKYRFVGANLGAWIVGKRLVSPVNRTNVDLRLDWSAGEVEAGIEGLYSVNDRNTFSGLDDGDNRGGILNAFARYGGLRLDYERRWDNGYFFSSYKDPALEYELATLETADSLAQSQLSLSFAPGWGQAWWPELTLLYMDIPQAYTQRALRFLSRSRGGGLLPALDLRSTVAAMAYRDSLRDEALLQFHQLNGAWEGRWFKAGLLCSYNGLEYEPSSVSNPGNRYYKVNPSLGLGDPRVSATNLGFSLDGTDLKVVSWQSLNQTQTYTLKHSTSTRDHSLNLDYTYRRIRKTGDIPVSDYDLINFRNNHNLLKQALILSGFYQLNQTEFFPRIRELEYIGDGLGLFDSTGVYTPEGDYDYVYVTSDVGTLSSELNAQLSAFVKPGNLHRAFNRVHTDIIVTAAEQGEQGQDWKRYLFLPGHVYNDDTIYGKQSYSQDLWLDLKAGRILGKLSLEAERSLDNRYQAQTRTYGLLRAAELEFKQYGPNNYSIGYEHRTETDSRYLSDIVTQNLKALWQRNLSPHSIFTLDLIGSSETGASQASGDGYTLRGTGATLGYRGSWSRKGRASGNFGSRYNQRRGTDFMSFLPEKREGWLFNWALSATYRLNGFSSASLEYSGNAYPGQDMKHLLKVEFKAEL
jgi:hypothetical protein